MNSLALPVIRATGMGLGATLAFDLGAQFLKHTFKIPLPNICLVGRWVRYMPARTFMHANIASAPRQSAECAICWVARYRIGITFATVFVVLAGNYWLQHPTLMPALVLGVVSVVAPFAIMQPAMRLGFAATKTAKAAQAGLRSLLNHTAFGIGLYVCAWLVNRLTRVNA